MRSNLIGHTNFFTNERNRIGFSRLSGRPCEVIEMSVYNVPCLPRIMASRFVYVNLVEHFIEYQENENTREKTQVSECPSTTVQSASSAADFQRG